MEMVNRVEATEVGDRGRYKESTEVSYTLAHTLKVCVCLLKEGT